MTIAPLTQGSHTSVRAYTIETGMLIAERTDGSRVGLQTATAFQGYRGAATAPTAILLAHNGLHAEIVIDRGHPIGKTDPAGMADLVLESALTTIMDLEDSIAAVDASDKVAAYRNWLGLNTGKLVETFEKGGKPLTRRMNPDRLYVRPDGGELHLHGRCADADPQRRPPHDRCERPRPQRQAGPRGHSRRRRHVADRHARSEAHKQHE